MTRQCSRRLAGFGWRASSLFGQILTLRREPRRVPLPTYPFERKRYWVEASSGGTVTAGSDTVPFSEDVGDWLFAPTWTRAPSCVDRPAAVSGSWLLLLNQERWLRLLAIACGQPAQSDFG